MVRLDGVRVQTSLSLVFLPHAYSTNPQIVALCSHLLLYACIFYSEDILQSHSDEPATPVSFAREHAWFSEFVLRIRLRKFITNYRFATSTTSSRLSVAE
jgi:hypothetical protein